MRVAKLSNAAPRIFGGRGQPLRRRMVQVVERDQSDGRSTPREGSLRGSAAICACTSGGGLDMTQRGFRARMVGSLAWCGGEAD